MENKLNNLDGKAWLKFTKSWFYVNAKARSKNEIKHPAKYPEEMVEEFVSFFTKENEIVLDPFLGVGSTSVGAEKTNRKSIGIELNKDFFKISESRINNENHKIYNGDCREVLKQLKNNSIDYILTSPPYWDMLKKKRGHSDSQHGDRLNKGLNLYYSDNQLDLGNIEEYDVFLNELVKIFILCAKKLKPGKYMTIVIQNFRNNDGQYITLAWDLAKKLSKTLDFVGEKIWIQDNKKLGIWGYKASFIPNIHHHYCLNFRKKK